MSLTDFRQRMVDLLRQWPWIYPRGIEPSAQKWIQRAQERGGWYAGLRSDWYEEIYPGGISVYPQPAGLSDEHYERLVEALLDGLRDFAGRFQTEPCITAA